MSGFLRTQSRAGHQLLHRAVPTPSTKGMEEWKPCITFYIFLQSTAWTIHINTYQYTFISFIIFAKQHAGHEIPSSGRCHEIAGPEDSRMVGMGLPLCESVNMCEARVCAQQFDCHFAVVYCRWCCDFFSWHDKHDKVFQAQLQVDLFFLAELKAFFKSFSVCTKLWNPAPCTTRCRLHILLARER